VHLITTRRLIGLAASVAAVIAVSGAAAEATPAPAPPAAATIAHQRVTLQIDGVTATGSDDYQALVAWAEFDPEFEAKTLLVALTEDGQPATDGRARLVVPGDIKGGRYVSSLVRLHVSR
jgi:hypothetical protein